MMEERNQWFIDRIGKRIYRNKTSCPCCVCETNYKDGLIISDEKHADYIYCCECEYTAEGHKLKYFDTIKERDDYESSLIIK